MRHSLPAAVIAAFVALVGVAPESAFAADCAQPYSSDTLLDDLTAVEAAAQGGDQGTSIKTATKMERGLSCLEEKLVPMLVGRTYRSIGAGYFVGGDANKARRWLRTAIEVDPAYGFGTEEYAPDHPLRLAYDEIKMGPSSTPRAVEGKTFVDGKFYLDGRSLSQPAATAGRPHLLQQVGDGVQSWVIDGNTFPSELLADGGGAVADAGKTKEPKVKKPKAAKEPKPAKEPKAAKEPKPAKEPKAAKEPKDKDPAPLKPAKEPKAAKPPKKPADSSSDIERVRPKEKTPLLIAGGVLAAGAGGLYGAAVVSRQNFNSIKDSEDDLRKAQQTTNRLYLGSIAVLAVGAGTFTWGVMVDGGRPMPTLRVRF